ncbi:MAG TPA: GldG family protein [Candidatus Acidoferrum sp.]|nr:GldG family protein [Candidatus Acidoferrum sp.]
MERLMLRRLGEAAFWIGLVLLAAAVLQGLGTRFNWSVIGAQWNWLWWPFVIGGLALVLLSFLPLWRDPRGTLSTRGVRYGVNTLVAVLLVVGVIGVVEALSYRHNARLDLTENRRNSVSSQTVQVLRGLKTKVDAVAFYRSEQPGKRVIEDLFKQYARYAGDKFTWKVVDPDRDPTLARALGVENYGTTVLQAKGRTEKVQDADQEEKLTNALVKVLREGKPVVYVAQGHGEPDLGNTDRPGFSEAKTALEKANYEVKPLVLARQGKVPDDAAILIVAGPRTDFFGPEIEAIDAYLGRGGKLLAMVNPPFPERNQPEALRKLLGRWGLGLDDDLVIELNPIGQVFGIGPQVPIVQQYEPHPITRDMRSITTLFPLTRSITLAKTPPTGVALQPLARTTPDSWGETDRQALEQGQARPDPADPKGPLTLAAAATKDKTRIVLFGTANLAVNQFLNVQGNPDFFMNTVSWLAEQEDQISIRPRDTKSTPVFLTSQQAQAVFWLPVVILPGLAMAGGIVTVVRRRAAK